MIWETIRAGWEAWRRHKVTGIPFLISGLVSTAIFLSFALFLVFKISPELVLSGDMAEVNREYFTRLFERYLENLDLIFYLLLVGSFLFIIFDTLFRAWGIKVCFDALECKVGLLEGFKYAKSRYFPFLIYRLTVDIIVLAGLVPVYFIVKAIKIGDINSLVQSAIAFFLWGVVFLCLISVVFFLFTFIPYAIVLDGESVLSGIKKGLQVLRISIAETIVFWLLVILAGMVVGIPFQPLHYFGISGIVVGYALSAIVGWLTVAPITTAWWVELYKRKSKML
ncbi:MULTISPECIES: hypothetical protein [unclassified Archaeoglobus]|jgi:hypothetical protein|uniref:DUF7847 domain-containing protein n=1 Tax=unclassified Archaeoglobus TaxID=2643606 RepID=UPI0025BCF80D|nr:MULTISPECIES: hypothetical protein [unclassified Archaeoglobus]